MTWQPTAARILALAALVVFILASFSAAGMLTADTLFLLAVGLACLAASMVV